MALSGAAGSAVNSAVSAAQGAKQSSDSRLAALQGTQAVLSGVQAGQAVALDQAKGTAKDNTNTIGISASLGSQSSKSTSHSEQDSTTGSTLDAGNSVNITSTGSDITIAGSEVKAGTNEYKTAAASSGSQRSILTVDPQSLLPQLGTGQQVGKVEVGLAGSKERIDFGKPIGNFVDRDTGLSVPTTKGIVHYGKDGAHIVPARP